MFFYRKGKNALEVFNEAIKESKEIKPEYKGAAKGYFKTLIDDAMKYDMSETPELEVSLEYRGGQVYINTEKTHFDSVI